MNWDDWCSGCPYYSDIGECLFFDTKECDVYIEHMKGEDDAD